jgi:photosystem II stability/assembly factor-like uncharacterized protein
MNRRFLLLAPLFALSLMGAGCFGIGGSSTPSVSDGGVFRTRDEALKWEQLKVLNLDTQIGSTVELGTVSVSLDPQDPNTVYVGTSENGLIYTTNNGQSWQLSAGLSKGKINGIVVDAKDRCTVYALRANQLQKTTTCGREWGEVWSHPRATTVITSIVGDWYNPKTLYIGTSDGDILRSDDGATTWRPMHRIDNTQINDLKIDPKDSRVIYAATNGAGIAKSIDGGATWIDIRQQLQEFQYARTPKLLVLDPNTKDRIYHISKYGLLVSDDAGATWRAVTLPTAPQDTEISSFIVNPKDPKILVYSTKTALVMSKDGGTTWASKKLPTTRGVSWMTYSREEKPALLLGAIPLKK